MQLVQSDVPMCCFLTAGKVNGVIPEARIATVTQGTEQTTVKSACALFFIHSEVTAFRSGK